jgi:hypothetical protein
MKDERPRRNSLIEGKMNGLKGRTPQPVQPAGVAAGPPIRPCPILPPPSLLPNPQGAAFRDVLGGGRAACGADRFAVDSLFEVGPANPSGG